MTQVLVTKPGVLTTADKKLLRQAGVVPIEAAKPTEVRLLQVEGPPLSGDDMLFAALSGVQKSSTSQIEFTNLIFKLIEDRRKGST